MKRSIRKMECSHITSFIEQGGDVNYQETYKRHDPGIVDSDYWATISLIERAVEEGCAELVLSLIKKGASLNQKSIWDFYVDVKLPRHRELLTPLFLPGAEDEELDGDILLFLWSLFFQNLKVSQVLYEAFVFPCNDSIRRKTMLAAMNLSAEIHNLDVVRFLLERGGWIVVNTSEGSVTTVLLQFCREGNVEGVRYLLENGADPDVMTFREEVPLLESIAEGEEEIALLLVEHGANLTIQTKARPNARPISMAKRYKMKRLVTVIQAKLPTQN